MDKQKYKQRESVIRAGFTLVELLIVVAIIAILSGAAYIGIRNSQSRGMNERMADDLSAITNALEQYKQDNGAYPLPSLGADKNVLCFGEDLSYAHGGETDCASALFMQAQIDNTLLTKRYLQEVPTDPRTSSRYAYGVTVDGKYYQVAGIFEESDGTWTARTAGNVAEYPFLTSLIRAYNGPDFVVDGEGWLPYSPDHLAITATLADITGTVKVDGNGVSDGTIVKPGSTVTAASGASVTLYFSDGSITYLDGTGDPLGASLRVLPTTAVEQNDKDGIITKIRLKLSFGKIWNKVARLASESEFNVETTSAIAGVRGTEFGITAASTPAYPELIVLSGTVVARHISDNEALSAGTEGIPFSSADTAFDNKKAAGDGNTFKQFTLPTDPNAPLTSPGTAVSPSVQDEIIQKYYSNTLGLSLADTPYIIKAASKTDGTYTLYVTFNGFEENTPKDFNGFEIYGESQTGSELRTLKDDALGHPLIIAEAVTYSPADKAWIFDIDSKTSPGNPLNQAGEMESVILRAFRHNYGKTVYSRLSWPPIGLAPDATAVNTYTFDSSQVYQEFFGMAEPQPPQQPVQIITPSVNVTLGNDFNYTANVPCNWSIQTGSGALVPISGIHTTYKSVDPGLSLSDQIVDISVRFNNTQTNSTTLRCTDPLDPNNKDEVTFFVNYDSYKKSLFPPNGSGYRYSWKAGKKTWYEAKASCVGFDNLTAYEQNVLSGQGYLPADFPAMNEGGLNWTLPSKGATAGGMDIADGAVDGKTSLAEIGLTCLIGGNTCSDPFFGGAGAVWLNDENGGQALAAYIFNQLLNLTNKTSSYAFRCVAL